VGELGIVVTARHRARAAVDHEAQTFVRHGGSSAFLALIPSDSVAGLKEKPT
jgi:hypothetical protein